jgi:hypothetical protein
LHLKNLGGFVLAGALTRSVIAPDVTPCVGVGWQAWRP